MATSKNKINLSRQGLREACTRVPCMPALVHFPSHHLWLVQLQLTERLSYLETSFTRSSLNSESSILSLLCATVVISALVTLCVYLRRLLRTVCLSVAVFLCCSIAMVVRAYQDHTFSHEAYFDDRGADGYAQPLTERVNVCKNCSIDLAFVLSLACFVASHATYRVLLLPKGSRRTSLWCT
jgi:hypothetical protein